MLTELKANLNFLRFGHASQTQPSKDLIDNF